jgi:hypothetical protein
MVIQVVDRKDSCLADCAEVRGIVSMGELYWKQSVGSYHHHHRHHHHHHHFPHIFFEMANMG